MKIALIGHGVMGKTVSSLAVQKGHSIGAVIDRPHDRADEKAIAAMLNGADAVIDFSSAGAVRRNVNACLHAKIPIVVGTTGWNAEAEEIKKIVADGGGAMVFGANFSVGVNIFYQVVDHAAELIRRFNEYECFIEEQHHSRKLDAPSGTAIKLAEIIENRLNGGDEKGRKVGIASTRAGNIAGVHRVGFDGPADQILLEHAARTREGFAGGAVLAAEWIKGRTGVFEFGDVMFDILKK